MTVVRAATGGHWTRSRWDAGDVVGPLLAEQADGWHRPHLPAAAASVAGTPPSINSLRDWSTAASANRCRRGGHPKCANRAGGPQPRVLGRRVLLERDWHQIKVDPRRWPSGVVSEEDSRAADAELGEVDPEDVGVLVV